MREGSGVHVCALLSKYVTVCYSKDLCPGLLLQPLVQ